MRGIVNKSLLIAVAAGFGICVGGCGKKAPVKQEWVRPVKAVLIENNEASARGNLPGKAEAVQEVNLAFEVSGTISKRLASKGDRVKRGDLLAELDPRDFQNALKAATAEVASAQSRYDRIKRVADSGAVSEQDLADAEASLAVAKSQMNIKEKALEDTHIYAPFDGIVADTYAENFQRVSAKQKVVRLLDFSKIKVTIYVPEHVIVRIDNVDKLNCRFDAFADKILPAKIVEIGTEASKSTRTYPITLELDQPEDGVILPGMACEVFGIAKLSPAEQGVGIVPSALFSPVKGQECVWVVGKDMRVSRRDVKTTRLATSGVVVKGINPGEIVVTAGVNYLVDGQQVRLMDDYKGGEK